MAFFLHTDNTIPPIPKLEWPTKKENTLGYCFSLMISRFNDELLGDLSMDGYMEKVLRTFLSLWFSGIVIKGLVFPEILG